MINWSAVGKVTPYRKCSPIVLLTVLSIICLSFMYHVTLQYVVVVDVRRHSLLSHDDTRFIWNFNSKDEHVIKHSLGDGMDASAIRMALLTDALSDLKHIAYSISINYTEYQVITSGNNEQLLCDYYNKEGNRHHSAVTNVWQDTGYYYPEDVTLVTQVTIEKLGALSLLLRHWEGPVSCTIYLEVQDLNTLPKFLIKFPNILKRDNVDIHLVLRTGVMYPINFLRNVALNNSYTDYVLLMDVDFMPSYGLHQYLLDLIPLKKNLKHDVLVVPAMEFTSHAGIEFPRNKSDLLYLWSLKVVASSEEIHWQPSHKPTDYSRWKTATTPYHVTHAEGYEPYIVGHKDLLPRYNVSFLGGFRDKISHILLVHASGFKFLVIPDHFAIHVPHNRETRPPFYKCSVKTYQGLLDVLTSAGIDVHNQSASLQGEPGAPRKRIVRRIIRKIIRRKVKTALTTPSQKKPEAGSLVDPEPVVKPQAMPILDMDTR